MNSGSEANDFAVLLARLHTGNFDIISLRNGYHGMCSLAMALTAQSSWRNDLPLPAGFHHVSNTLKFLAYVSSVDIQSSDLLCCSLLLSSLLWSDQIKPTNSELFSSVAELPE